MVNQSFRDAIHIVNNGERDFAAGLSGFASFYCHGSSLLRGVVFMAMSFAQLQILARERSPGRRHELLSALLDAMFKPAHGPSVEERDRFDEMVARVLDDIEPVARQELAGRLAAGPDAPRPVVVRLAHDIIAVAAPVLTCSPVLGDDDLAPLAWAQSQDHLLAIARRERLSERITDILVDRGDAAVLDGIAENLGARFSATGAAMLIDKARLRETLWRRLANRADLAGPIADRLTLVDPIAAGTRDLRREPAKTPALPEEMQETPAARRRAAAARARPPDQLADLLAAGTLRLSEAVVELADGDRVSDLAVLLCRRTAVKPHGFVRNLFAPDEAPLMKMCRSAGLDLESFSAVLRLRRRRRPFGAGAIGRLLRAYQALPVPPDALPSTPSTDDPEECAAGARQQGLRRLTD
jgi:uncharacterized protein (DUF2336 family)